MSEMQQIGKSILVSPNLGHPIILQIDRKLKKKKFQMSLLFVSDISDPEIFNQAIQNKIQLLPLFDYKWSYKLIFVKKPTGLFSKWKEKRARKKRKKFLKEKMEISTTTDLDLTQLKKYVCGIYYF